MSRAMSAPPSPVGTLLQHWRRVRGMSQLALSHEAGVTQRHVSFVESGRATPSREMVLTLARAMTRRGQERGAIAVGITRGRGRRRQHAGVERYADGATER